MGDRQFVFKFSLIGIAGRVAILENVDGCRRRINTVETCEWKAGPGIDTASGLDFVTTKLGLKVFADFTVVSGNNYLYVMDCAQKKKNKK